MPTTSYKVLIHGLAYFSRQIPAVLQSDGWEIRNYSPRWSTGLITMANQLRKSDLAFSWGGRISMGKFLYAARLLNAKNVVLFWCGSDVLEGLAEFKAGKADPWVKNLIHWAGAPWLAEEVRSMGLACEYVPITWIPAVPELPALPEEFSVLSYLPDSSRVSLYGIDQVVQAAREMPHVRFRIVGLGKGQTLDVPGNVSVHHHVPDLAPFMRNATVVWRPARHDGLSFTALEALSYGRHLIWSYPITGGVLAKDAPIAKRELERLLGLHQAGKLKLNRIGADFVNGNFSREAIRRDFLARWQTIIESRAPHVSGRVLKPARVLSPDRGRE